MHLKRITAPRTWDLPRKKTVWVTTPNPGKQLDLSLPLDFVLRDILGKARTKKEVNYIVTFEEVRVNGKRRKDRRYPLSFLDILTLPKLDEHYMILVNKQNKLYLQKLSAKEAESRLCKLTNKTITTKGVQLNFLDGTNLLVKKDGYKTGDTLILATKDNKVVDHLKLEKGASVLLYKGKHAGTVTHVENLEQGKIYFKSDKQTHQTNKAYAIVIGKDKPMIKI